ncbi:MAG: hypothetical protein C0600_08195 [Ignavibacteria bacterium]|nr:MAG: hypothetical protein C0600_08195 [Ignavibacteria bacterium]
MGTRLRRIVLAVTVVTSAALSCLLLRDEPVPTLPDRDELSMYLLLIDRFEDGEPQNNHASGRLDNRKALSVQGGDLAGVEQRLPYLKALGMNAIWLTPVQANVGGAFHGYWIQHFKQVDPRLGSMEDLRRLIKSAHEMGMRVYLDVVCNHTGPLIGTVEGGYEWNDQGYTLAWHDSTQMPTPEVLQDLDLYHPYGLVKEWSDPYQILGELPGGLDDFRTEDPRVLAAMIEIWSWWMEQTGCDGFRVDTVKHVDMAFWHAWLKAMRQHAIRLRKTDFFIFGEVFAAEDEKCASYTWPDAEGNRGFDAVFNFSLATAVRDVFARKQSVHRLVESVQNLDLYSEEARGSLLTFVDNHDKSRFLAAAERDTTALIRALGFIYAMPGIPVLYYGTEQGFVGGTGPDWENRECMFAEGWKGANPSGDAFGLTGRVARRLMELQELRKKYHVLRQGDLNILHEDTLANVLVLSRHLGDARAYLLINEGDAVSTVSLPGDPDQCEQWPTRFFASRTDGDFRLTLPPRHVHLMISDPDLR